MHDIEVKCSIIYVYNYIYSVYTWWMGPPYWISLQAPKSQERPWWSSLIINSVNSSTTFFFGAISFSIYFEESK
jgi:hypothetical protein